jgi:hypothetical protein
MGFELQTTESDSQFICLISLIMKADNAADVRNLQNYNYTAAGRVARGDLASAN